MKKKQTIPVFKKRKNKKGNIIIGPGQSKHIKIIGPELSFETPDVDRNYVDKATYGELTEKINKLENHYLLIGEKEEHSVEKKTSIFSDPGMRISLITFLVGAIINLFIFIFMYK